MSEFMGLIRGVYDAKANGFLPGQHNCNTGAPYRPGMPCRLASQPGQLALPLRRLACRWHTHTHTATRLHTRCRRGLAAHVHDTTRPRHHEF